MHDVVIVGAGAMGCLFAARLAESGAAVTLVDVDLARLAALRRDGVTLDDDRGTRTVAVAAALAAEITAAPDLILLFTKGVHSAAAIRSVAHLAAPGTYALTLQNGIGNAEALAELFAPERVLMGVTDYPSNLEGPTRVSSHGGGHVRLGAYRVCSGAVTGQAAALIGRAGFHAEVDPDIAVAMWEKVAFNAALNPLGAVTGLPNGGLDGEAGRRIARAIVRETVAVAAALGIALDRARIEGRLAHALAHHRDHKASMLQDRLAGRRTEIETINGAIVRAGAQNGVPTPVTETMADLVRLIEAATER